MRISDWSSDVCSSDLAILSPGGTAEDYTRSHTRKVADVMTADVVSVTEDQPVAVVVKLMEKHRIKRVPVVRGGKVIGLEIGRASCRESVGPYVSISVVSVQLKKKNTTTQN